MYDPTTSSYVQPTSCEVDLAAIVDSCPTSNENTSNTNTKLSFSLQDLHETDLNSQCVNLAALFNYTDDKDLSNFAELNLPEIDITYDSLTHLFFNDVGKGFAPHVLNKIWKGITNFSLASTMLHHYESLTGIERNNIPAVLKIQLHKECAIDKITKMVKKTYGLNQQEFNLALGSVVVRADGKIHTNIVFYLYFNSLKIGLQVKMRFAVSNTPSNLIGVFASDQVFASDSSSVAYDFSKVPGCVVSTSQFIIDYAATAAGSINPNVRQ